ncbi:hypothetical protein EUX48_00455 [Haemophilus haemolyticus]|uniref:Uncharacterized protein n=1 Tax=Haemophilus haemolyticus TaxID=726 RepID=A0A502LN66_HAEHA|nr:ESPR-type extended signal peptide-containing protein [Haemophilus haemolyticus]TPH25516.1 hypothetical protein EUX48_00455 [Haemophilus haemolyticus]
MNKIFRIVWSHATQSWVAVSELTKAHKKQSRNSLKAAVGAAAVLLSINTAEAEVLIGQVNNGTIAAGGSVVSPWGITIGGAIDKAGSYSVHVGDETLEEGERNVIIGTHATAGVDNGKRQFVKQSTAIGGGNAANQGARAFGDQSIAIGANTIAEGNSSIAIGNDDVDKAVDKQLTYTNSEGNKVTGTLGNAYNNLTGKNLLDDGGQYADTRSGEAAVAIGVKAESGDISLALGTGAKAKVVNGVAVGTGATVDVDNAVAIGGGATTEKRGTKETSTTVNNFTFKWAGGDKILEGDIVSFGKEGYERQLKNVAAGNISENSTDAINGSQLYGVLDKITSDPTFLYAADNSSAGAITGDKPADKIVDAKAKKIVARAMNDGRLNLLGGADKDKLSENNIGVTYDNENTIKFKLAKELTGLTSTNVGGIVTNADGINMNNKPITNVTSGLANHTEPGKAELRNLTNANVTDGTAATVGDLRNMGWVVSSNKTTGADGTATDAAYSATVKNANEVKFVGKGGAIVSGSTDANGVRTITVEVDKKATAGAGSSESPVAYTKADGTKVYPVKAEDGSVTYHTTPNGEGPNDAVVPGTEVITSVNGPDGTTTPATLTNVAGNLVGAKKDTTAPTTEQAAPTLGKGANEVNPNNAATVGDVLNAGWNLQNNNEAKDFVKAYDTVNFINGDGTTAVVETTDNKVSKIKYNVNTGNGLEKTTDNKIAVKPGDKSLEVTEAGVTVKKADQSLEVTDAGLKVKTDGTTITAGDNGLTINTGTVNAVESGDKKGTVEVPTADAGKIATVDTVVKAVNSASFTLKASATTDGTRNAGSAVDENGEQIKAGSTVELVAGKNLDVKHDIKGKITFATKDNVTFETVQVGGSEGPKLAKTDSGDLKLSDKDDTKPVAITNVKSNLPETKNGAPAEATKAQPAPTLGTNADQVNASNAATVGDVLNAGWNLQENGTAKDFVKPYDTVNFVNGANTTAVVTTSEDGTTSKVTYNVTGLPVSYTTEDGKPVSKVGDKFYTVNEKGQPVTADGKPAVGTNAEGKLVTADGTVIEPIDPTKTPLKTALVNPTPAADKTGTTSPTALNNVTSNLANFAEPTVNGKVPAKNALRNLDNTDVSDNTAATVGDLRNMGWIVSSDKTTGDLGNPYSEAVKNANEVKFVGTGTAIVSGKTDEKGVRTITVNVDDQVSANNATTPVVYTKADGTKVYPIKDENGAITYHTTPDGKGKDDQEVPGTEVITSVNSPDGTTTPATLANVAGNLDGAKKDTITPKTEAAAPNTTNKDGDKYINPNNAATVGDVLNAGWNLQENGTAKDFVKPYDTVNFINGANTTAVVTTSEDGTTSKVTYNVTGLPVSYTTKDGKPVSKVGDKFYKVNEKGQPLAEDGTPAAGTDKDGNPITADGTVIKAIDPTVEPLKTALVNPNAPDAQTTTPTQLTNVANGADTFKPANNVKQANDGKWYNAADVAPNGAPKAGAQPVVSPLTTTNAAGEPLEKGADGNWYKPSELTNGEPNPGATQQTPADKPANAEKAGLVNFEGSNPNNAATVGDLQNLGFIVSAADNGYTEQMRNANKVEFKGSNGVSVTGKTLENGTREITVSLKEGRVTNNVIITKADGTEVHGERGEDGKVYHYEKDPVTGQPKKVEVPVVAGDTVTNDGDAYVTGNSVATAIQKSGWNIGIGSTTKEFSKEEKVHEKVNPNDNVKYVNGDNTTVSMAVDSAEDKDGTKVTTTYVKFDVNAADLTHNTNGTVNGPVTAEMKKALDEAKKALADLPANATPEAKKVAEDKVNVAQANINKVGNPVATAQSVADAINNSGFTLTTSENGGKKLSGGDEIINPGKKVDLAAGKNMTVKQDAEGKVTYATADEVNFSSVQFGDNGPKINAAGDNINIGDKDGNPTKITGVKAGDISPTSTDAVNGAQIYALSRGNVPNVENITVTNPDGSKTTYKDIVVDENGTPILKTYNVQGQKEIITNSVVEAVHNMNEQGIKFFHSNDGVNRPKVEIANSFDSSASGKFATAIGKSAVAHGDNSVAMGNSSKALGNDSIAIGTGNIVEANNSGAFGDPNVIKADATGSYAFGNNNVITTKNTFVLGNDVNNAGNSTSREGTVENSVYLGNKSTATAGDGSRTASLYNIKQDGTKGTSTTAGSVGTVTTATVGNMTYGGFQGAKANGVVSVGAAGDERRIQNVAAGEISSTSTDAINGSQLYSVANGVGNRINNLQGQVNKLGKRMNAGVAGAMAAANLMQPHKPGQSAAMAAIGQHHGEAAVAVGYSRISDNGKYGVKLSVGANTQGQLSTGAGVSYFW